MLTRSRGSSVAVALLWITLGCESTVVDPSVDVGVTSIDHLRFELRVEPEAVALHEEFEAEVRITNTGSRPVVVTAGCPLVAWIFVTRGGEPVDLEGGDNICLGVIVTFSLDPGESVGRTRTLRARTPDGAAIPEGEYRISAEFLTEGKPTVHSSFRVE